MALDAGGPSITTLEELLPLLEGVTKVKEFGWIIIQNVPTKPVTLKRQLALAARDHFGRGWTDNTLNDWLKPGRHTENWAEAHRKANRANSTAYYEIPENKERKRTAKVAWHEANPEYRNDYQRDRRANDPAYKIADCLRSRLYKAVKAGGAGKSASTIKLTGCALPELMAHLESQFQPGMTWENQGQWEIDHIKPCASFDLTKPEEQRACFHWTNLAPLWAADNRSKGDKLDWSPSAQIEPQAEP